MTEDHGGERVMQFPRLRRLTADGGRIAAGRHGIHGLLEADVTVPRAILRERKARTGSGLSFTAFLLHCLGAAVDADPRVHACRDWRGRLHIFDEVNVNMALAAPGGREAHLVHVMKAVNKRSVQDIHDEIRAYQGLGAASQESRWIERFVALPWFARRLVYTTIYHTPRVQHEYYGTVSLTAVGMFGSGGGWGIGLLVNALCVTVGGIERRPGLVEDRVEPREYLCLTVSYDHDLVDGAPAARFAGHFRELIESGYGLDA